MQVRTLQVCVAETDYNSGIKQKYFQQLLDAFAATDLWPFLHDFLVSQGEEPMGSGPAMSNISDILYLKSLAY